MTHTGRAILDTTAAGFLRVPHSERNQTSLLRFEVLMALKIQVEVFWVVMPCTIVVGY
jgi:hypothetical protein